MSWPLRSLVDLAEKIGSGSTPRGGDSVYVESGTPLIRSQNIYNSEFTPAGLVFIDEQMADKMKGVTVLENDVLLNITGDSVARCSLVDNNFIPARVNQHVAIIRTKKELLTPDFLMFYLVSPYMQAKLLSWSGTGGTRKALTKGMIEGFEVPVPPIDLQKSIVKVLKTYTLLIENNRRRIQLLEQSMRLLYQEWFVHLRFPGHEHAKIVDGVPEGWWPKVIDDISEYINRGISPNYDDDGEYLVINQKCIRNRLLSLYLARRQSKEYKIEKAVQLGDVLINSTGTGTLGRVAQVWSNLEKTTVDSHVTIVRPNKDIPYFWLGYTLMSLEKRLEDMGEGATNQKELNRARIREIEVKLPPKLIMEEFHNFASSVANQILILIQQNNKLVEARDILLPRLMNGTISV